MCDTLKKIFKVVGIIVAIAGAIAGIYMVVTKLLPCSNPDDEDDECNYVSCSCFDDEPEAEAK